ncbi:MAG: NADPH-dependent F420 reductase [Candidatus Hadarchaeum sp.]|uniref:NADPH-dependent F420 reductase n=1 Tax=Candidatus Hadarchaeum sp. TaxID=2883567 RepID=UPI003D0FA553
MIAILGGTGDLGQGLAMRWAMAGEKVIIGSRSKEKAEKIAQELSAKIGKSILGDTNLEATRRADFVVLSVPFEGCEKILEEVVPALTMEKIMLSAMVPLKPTDGLLTCYSPPAGSAAETVAKMVGDRVRVCSALQSVGAQELQRIDRPVEGDTVVCGDDAQARRQTMNYVEKIANLRAIDGGRLCNSRLVEPVTALLIKLTARYKVPAVGIKFIGLDKST